MTVRSFGPFLDRDPPMPQRDQVRDWYPGGRGIGESRGIGEGRDSRFAIDRPNRDSSLRPLDTSMGPNYKPMRIVVLCMVPGLRDGIQRVVSTLTRHDAVHHPVAR